jgi:hypothetical protein
MESRSVRQSERDALIHRSVRNSHSGIRHPPRRVFALDRGAEHGFPQISLLFGKESIFRQIREQPALAVIRCRLEQVREDSRLHESAHQNVLSIPMIARQQPVKELPFWRASAILILGTRGESLRGENLPKQLMKLHLPEQANQDV